MLVLTRKLMEKIYIGDQICVTVVRVDKDQVRLGIEAPREISVLRAELAEKDRERLRPTQADQGARTAGSERCQGHAPVVPSAVRPPSISPRGNGIRRREPSR